jgi:cellulose synthase/poly-beta-1,6-N-acetylglucosamine synthase-like glycosyltransferase
MIALDVFLVLLPGLCFGYAYLLYPAVLKFWGFFRPPSPTYEDPPEWPIISFSVPAYNEEASIRRTIEGLCNLDYPSDRRQIVVVSDASTDGTDAIVREYADRGVELVRLPTRMGKTAAENAAAAVLRGEIVVNTDATIRIPRASLKPLIRAFQDPTVGVASGRDVSVGDIDAETNQGESGYVGYEMWLRSLETRVGSIVGASGCFYAILSALHHDQFPDALSRDFASALIAREHGYRAVSVDEAVCLVARTASLNREFHRKIRTMARGLETLWYKRQLLNPLRYGRFAWMLFSHKLSRWLVFLAAPLALVGLALLSLRSVIAAAILVVVVVAGGVGIYAMRVAEGRSLPGPVGWCGFVFATHLAGLIAWGKAIRGERNPIWEPTRRPV